MSNLKKKIIVKMPEYETTFVNNFIKLTAAPIVFVLIAYFSIVREIRWAGIISFILINILSLTLFRMYFKKCANKIEFKEEEKLFIFQFFIDSRIETYYIDEIDNISIKTDTFFYIKGGKKIIWKKNEKNNELFLYMKKAFEVKT